jgi:AcrR family transcriptional regulator
MGRPRIHDEHTASALLAVAERLLQERGTAALSLREVADGAGTSTQAVYTLFGSKEGLLGALGAHAMKLLRAGEGTVPTTDNPRQDLVEGALMFRRFALDHPALFEVAFSRRDPAIALRFQTATDDALAGLYRRFEPVASAGLLGGRTLLEAVMAYSCLCEGMAALELRATHYPPDPEHVWRQAVQALVNGFATSPTHRPPRRHRR